MFVLERFLEYNQYLFLFFNNNLVRWNLHTIKVSPLKYIIQWFLVVSKELCNYHNYLIPGHFHHSPNNKNPLIFTPWPPSHPSSSLTLFAVFMDICLFCTLHANWVTQRVAFCIWFLSLSTVFPRPLCIVSNVFYFQIWTRLG